MESRDNPGVPGWVGSYRESALRLFRVGVRAADPGRAVRAAVDWRGDRLVLRGPESMCASGVRSRPWSAIHLIAFGKAACAMAAAVRAVVPVDCLAGRGIVVTNVENRQELAGIDVIGAGHPLPDAEGLRGACVVARRALRAQAGELVLVLVSGGGSALLPCPVEGVTLEDKMATTERLLACGADIHRVNCVRKHLSRIKGGGLARMAAPADVHALILSDVLGDDLSVIASGPTVPDPTTYADAVEVLIERGVWAAVPRSVQSHLDAGRAGRRPETPKPGDSVFRSVVNTLVGSNRMSVDAVIDAARGEGFDARLYSDALCGEARIEADRLAVHVAQLMREKAAEQPLALVAGGETTVTLAGNGRGGRNQELALAFALAAERCRLEPRWVLLGAGTDGRDGPTDAAGGLVDPWTLSRLARVGVDPRERLAHNDAYHALRRSDDLVVTGATGTNVADLTLVLIHPRQC